MANVNRCTFIGNLTKTPEVRVTSGGLTICQFSIAINRSWKSESGEKKEEVTYIDLEAWGKTGEAIAKYMDKGRPIYVESRAKLDQWEDKNTKEKQRRMKFIVESFQFLGDGKRAEDSPAKTAASAPGDIDEDVAF